IAFLLPLERERADLACDRVTVRLLRRYSGSRDVVMRASACETESDVEDDRDRPVVHELEAHSRAEGPRLDLCAALPERIAKGLVHRFRLFWRRRLREAWPVALARI